MYRCSRRWAMDLSRHHRAWHRAADRRFLSAHARRCAAGARCRRALHAWDRYKKLHGHLTFTSHYHVEHSKNFLDKQKQQQSNGVPRGLETPGFVKTFKARGADIVHLAEFHYENGWRIAETNRLNKLKVMHDEMRRLTDSELLLLLDKR